MDSLSKALIMVAGVLLAMIVIAFFTYSLNNMSGWASSKQDELQIEQIQKFNKEFEAYDKKLMYGVDVISCLNKAISINDKVEDGSYDKLFEVKISLKLKDTTSLEDSITVYHMTSKSGKLREDKYADGNGPAGSNRVELKKLNITVLKKDVSEYVDFPTYLATKTLKYKNNSNSFELTAQQNGFNESLLRNLMANSTKLEETITNSNQSNSSQENSWTKVEVKSALYIIKTKRFNCNKIEYNSTTGRVNYMEFNEI